MYTSMFGPDDSWTGDFLCSCGEYISDKKCPRCKHDCMCVKAIDLCHHCEEEVLAEYEIAMADSEYDDLINGSGAIY